jgi:hypothetical protein
MICGKSASIPVLGWSGKHDESRAAARHSEGGGRPALALGFGPGFGQYGLNQARVRNWHRSSTQRQWAEVRIQSKGSQGA